MPKIRLGRVRVMPGKLLGRLVLVSCELECQILVTRPNLKLTELLFHRNLG